MSVFRSAATRRVVSPDPLLPVTRGAGACRPALEEHMDLEVRVMALEAGEVRMAVVSMPFLGWPARLCERIRAQVHGIAASNILVGSTHCHSAPDPYGFPDENGGYGIDHDYLYRVCDAAAAAVNEAVETLEPSVVKIATGEARGKIAYNYYAPDLYDPRCHVIQTLRKDGSAVATLVNYAIHPEVLLQQNVCSPDLVGPLQERIEELGGGTAVFMNSAQGGMVTADIRSPEGDKEEWPECVRIGRLLAEEALRIAGSSASQECPALWCGAHTLTFPVSPPMAMLFSMLHAESRGHDGGPLTEMTAQQNLVNLGNAQILTIPGEALPNIGFYLKRKMRGEHNLLFGLTNDAFGYIMTKVDYDSFKSYEYITATCLHEEMGERLIAESLKFIASSPSP